jgi:hypothetical protein
VELGIPVLEVEKTMLLELEMIVLGSPLVEIAQESRRLAEMGVARREILWRQ